MHKLILENGQPQWGVIDSALAEVNYLDYDLRTVMDKKIHGWRKKMGFNQFQFVGVMNEEVIAGVAVVDLKWLSNAFVYVYDVASGALYEKSLLSPLAWGTRFDNRPDTGVCRFSAPGMQVSIIASDSRRRIDVQVGGHLKMALVLQEAQAFVPLRLCSRAGYAGWVFTQKAAGLVARGRIDCHAKQYDLGAKGSWGSYDWSCGFMRRETNWNWACLSGRSACGKVVGLNLASGVNETGVTENALWIDDSLCKLDLAVFHFDRYQPQNPWRMTTSDGLVDLQFQPVGKRQEKLDAGFMASNFRQMFGYYSGTLKDRAGCSVVLKSVPGFAEDHYAKW